MFLLLSVSSDQSKFLSLPRCSCSASATSQVSRPRALKVTGRTCSHRLDTDRLDCPSWSQGKRKQGLQLKTRRTYAIRMPTCVCMREERETSTRTQYTLIFCHDSIPTFRAHCSVHLAHKGVDVLLSVAVLSALDEGPALDGQSSLST
jgi:hypothetical protein